MTMNSKNSGPSLIWTAREWYEATFFFACWIIALISPMNSMRTFNVWFHDRVRRVLLIKRHTLPSSDIVAGGSPKRKQRESTMNSTMDGDDRLRHSTASFMAPESSNYGSSLARDLNGRFRTMVQQQRKMMMGSLNETDELLPYLDRKVTERAEAEIFSLVIGINPSIPPSIQSCFA